MLVSSVICVAWLAQRSKQLKPQSCHPLGGEWVAQAAGDQGDMHGDMTMEICTDHSMDISMHVSLDASIDISMNMCMDISTVNGLNTYI